MPPASGSSRPDRTGACDLNLRDFLDVLKLRLELLRNRAWRLFLPRGLFDQLREFETNGERKVAELRTRRRVGRELLHLDAKQFPRGAADAVFKFLL